MGCNCKNKIAKIQEKYGNNGEPSNNIIVKVFKIVLQAVFGLFLGCIMMIAAVPFVIYVTIGYMTGKSPSIDISKLINFKKKG